MLEWIGAHVTAGSTLVVDQRFFGPPLPQTREQIEEKYAFLLPGQETSARKKRLDLAIRAVDGKQTYRIYTLNAIDDVADAFLFYRPTVNPDAASVLGTGAEYIIFNYTEVDAGKHRLMQGMPHLQLLVSFSPYREPSRRSAEDPYSITAAPHSRSDLFSRDRLGPYLELYRIDR